MSFEREATEWNGIRSLILGLIIKEGSQQREHYCVAQF